MRVRRHSWLPVVLVLWSVAGASQPSAADVALEAPRVIVNPGREYAADTRPFQGIPGIERAKNGRLWATWYGGGPTECSENYAMLATSGDDGASWSDVTLVVDVPGPVRIFDPCLWHDPDGRLWFFWAQGYTWWDGRAGVWAMVTEESDRENPSWSEPRRLCDGIMMNKPTVLSSGEWLLPVSIWFRDPKVTDPAHAHDIAATTGSHVYASTDHGRTWVLRGSSDVKERSCDEHMLVERADGTLWKLVRTTYGIGEAESADRGTTWTVTGPSKTVPHIPAARFFIRRLASGKLLLVRHNPPDMKKRTHLTAYLSDDDGRTWTGGLVLDERDCSYPDGVQAPDGTLYVIYDHERTGAKEIRMAAFTEEDVAAGKPLKARLGLLVNRANGTLPPATAPANSVKEAPDAGRLMKLHGTPWNLDGQPILGTYAGGSDMLDDLRQIRDVGMNVVLGGEAELDPNTPEGAFCRDNGIRVLHHLTRHVYHGVRLREPISPDQTTIPLFLAGKAPDMGSNVVQIDDETIRYKSMTETALVGCERGWNGTKPAAHREGVILFWPEPCATEIERVKGSPNLFGYYVLDDSPGDAVSALRALYATVQRVDPGGRHPVCAGFGDAGSIINLAPGVCDIMFVYWYPVSTRQYHRESTSRELQHMLTTARRRVPGIPFVGVYQAFDGRAAQTGQGVPTGDQLREQLEDFVREGASGLVAFISRASTLPGWADLPELKETLKNAHEEIRTTGGLLVRPQTESMRRNRLQPEGFWETPQPVPGVVPAWYVVGPFDAAGKMLDAAFPPDENVDLNAVYPVKFGTAGWRVRETTSGVIGFSNLYGAHGGLLNCVDYAYCEVTSPAEQSVQMRICSDDDAWVRLNGQEVYRFDGVRGLEYDKDVVPITLPKGTSRIEAKVHNRAGMWGLVLRFTDTEGRPLKGLEFSPAAE